MTRALFALAFAVTMASAACRSKPEASVVGASSVDAGSAQRPASVAADGRKMVTDDCLMCHAEDMLRQQRLTSAQWTKVVAKMSTWGSPIEPERTSALVAYLAETYGPDAGTFTPARIAADDVPRALAPEEDGPLAGGDASRGKSLFVSTCSACHGLDARGQLGVDLVERPILWRASDVARMVHEGRGRMAPLAGVTDAQIADVLAYLRGLRGA